MLCLFGLALWRAIELRSTPGIVIELLLYGGIAALLGCVLCVALSQRQGESSRRDAGQMQLLAVLGAVGALLLLHSPLSSPEIRLWIALCSLTIPGAACFLHAPCAAGSSAATVLLGTIISHKPAERRVGKGCVSTLKMRGATE